MSVNAPDEESDIYEWAKIANEDALELGNNVEIDDFVFINAGERTVLGDNSCIHVGSRIVGGGECIIGRNVAITYNCVLVTGYPKPTAHMSTRVPDAVKDSVTGRITLRDESFIGSGTVIMPDTVIGEGAVVTSLSYIDEDVPPWTIQYPNGERRDRNEIEIYDN